MANGKLSLEEFRQLDQVTRDYHIWIKLQVLESLNNRFAGKWVEKTIVWIGIGLGGYFIASWANMVFASPK